MDIRPITAHDVVRIREIWKEFYQEEFSFDEFHRHFVTCFAVVSDEGAIISAGGLRPILESVIVTDKNFSVRDRREALLLMLQANSYFSRQLGHDQIHAFIQDEVWKLQLRRHGFVRCKGEAMVLSL